MIGNLGVAMRPSTAAPSDADDRVMLARERHYRCDRCDRKYADRVEGEPRYDLLCGYCRPLFPKARVVER